MNTVAKTLGIVGITAVFAWFLKYGIGIENIHDGGWLLAFIVYAGAVSTISDL